MKGKKKEEFDYQSFEEQALKAMYDGKSLFVKNNQSFVVNQITLAMRKNENYLMEQTEESLVLRVRAPEKNWLMGYSFIMVVLNFVITIFSVFYFSGISCWGAFLAFSLMTVLFLNGYFWFYNGYENLEIDKKKSIFVMYKKGLFPFHKQTHELTKIKQISICSTDNSGWDLGSEDAALYGFSGGIICIDIERKIVKFGVSLNSHDACVVVDILNGYINENQP